MKLLLKILPALLPFFCFAQSRYGNFTSIDNHVRSIPTNEPQALARTLTADYSKEVDKVRAIYSWITQNISYQMGAYRPGRRNAITLNNFEDDDTTPLKPLDLRVAEMVLERRQGVCDGYARLFKTLCDYAGIKSVTIQGYADGNSGSPKFRSNHKWNAVMIDSSWHLLDATWGSGYITLWGNQFVQHMNEQYFLADPATFIKDHYPEDLQWTLLSNQPVLKEYNKAPYRHMAFFKHKITSYSPASGVIEAAAGDSITIAIETDDVVKKMFVSAHVAIDSSINQLTDSLVIKPVVSGKKIFYTYSPISPDAEWLHVIYDDEVIMRYRLNIKKPSTAAQEKLAMFQ